MIKLTIVRANNDIQYGKFGFVKNGLYFARQSKDGKQILVQDHMGRWVSVVNLTWARAYGMIKKFEENFTKTRHIYVRNWKELKEIATHKTAEDWE